MKNGCAFCEGPMSDAAEASLPAGAVSNNNMSYMVWDFCIWNMGFDLELPWLLVMPELLK